MKVFIKRNWFFILLGLVILTNIAIITNNFILTKQRKIEYQEFTQEQNSARIRQFIPTFKTDFYGSQCPEITKYSISGEKEDG